MTAVVIARGLQDFSRFIDALPELATEAAYLAINDTSRAAVPLIKSEMRKQIIELRKKNPNANKPLNAPQAPPP